MNISEKINRLSREPGTEAEKLYRILSSDEYYSGDYQRKSLGEGMEVMDQSLWGWWKPRFLLNHNLKTAYEWMRPNQHLARVDEDHIDWDSLDSLPETAMRTARSYSFRFPSFILAYHHGVALVQWQLIPDGLYYMDEDGYGMSDDEELNIYGVIDQEGNVISNFHYYTDVELKHNILDLVCEQAAQAVAEKSDKKKL